MHLIFNKNNNNIDIKLWNSCIDIDINSMTYVQLSYVYCIIDLTFSTNNTNGENETKPQTI